MRLEVSIAGLADPERFQHRRIKSQSMAQFPAATSSALAQKSPSERRAAATHGDRTQGPTLLRPPTALPCLAAGLRKEQSRPLLGAAKDEASRRSSLGQSIPAASWTFPPLRTGQRQP